jgi:serine/threonine protein phosphatase PrpC
MLQYNFHIKDNIGGRKEQQDFAGSLRTADGLLVVVCDGMGGARGGALAARMAVTIVLDQFKKSSNISAVNFLSKAIQIANNEIYTRSVDDPEYKGMGTTITALLLQEEKAVVAHVGDSRVYQLRGNTFGSKVNTVFRTTDHSKVFELVKRGILTEEQARTSEESNVILRALGIKSRVEVDIQDNLPYKKNDIFLLCTDGICGAVPEKLMIELLSKKGELKIRLNNLVDSINRIGFENGGEHDNMTAAFVECLNPSLLKSPFNKSAILKPLAIAASLAIIVFISIFLYSNASESLLGFSKETENNSEIENGQDSTVHKGINNGGTVDGQINSAKNSNYDSSKGNKQNEKSSESKTNRDLEEIGKADNLQTTNPSNSDSETTNINSSLSENKDTITPTKSTIIPVMIPPADTNDFGITTNTNGETNPPKIPSKTGKGKKGKSNILNGNK